MRWVVLCCVASIGCEDPPQRPSAPDSTATFASPSDAQASLIVAFDGKPLVTVKADQLAGKTPLAPFLPESARDPKAWRRLDAVSVDGTRRLDLTAYGDKYADFDVMLYRHDKHGPSLGLFRRPDARELPPHVKKKISQPHLKLVGVGRVNVSTKDRPKAKTELTKLVVSLDGKDTELLDQLTELETTAPPEHVDGAKRGRRRKRAGWPLAQVIDLVTPSSGIVAITATGSKHDEKLDAPWDDPDRVAIVRHTPRGKLELAVWTPTDANPISRIRELERLVLHRTVPKPATSSKP